MLLGLIYAGHMVVPNLHIAFVWPVWLVMTHSLVVGGLTHVIARKVPAVSRRAAFAAVHRLGVLDVRHARSGVVARPGPLAGSGPNGSTRRGRSAPRS